jgi:hypothetical protein
MHRTGVRVRFDLAGILPAADLERKVASLIPALASIIKHNDYISNATKRKFTISFHQDKEFSLRNSGPYVQAFLLQGGFFYWWKAVLNKGSHGELL